ncbi:uncharacterized protein TNIN_364102 [Trichonephila inaurata madagascariensis]|uniref:Uncharacterized protein n=1 Tax=Trichonephila inaurata madagascariensis TaxID=2747483 RepID=A0A8X7BXU8_9ARAC|nr:uncharacterized protein TNIN_364102 [Trichonephila inaurata madagascariensis]
MCTSFLSAPPLNKVLTFQVPNITSSFMPDCLTGAMSSLPQGWHGIPVPTRNSISSSVTAATAAVPTTIRKKWNSPLSNEVPRSKLPAYKPSNLRLHKNPVNGTIPTRTYTKASSSVPKSDVASSPPKGSPTKQYQNEIAKLKKELATIKTENSILKVKVRRVDDENLQKSRQIEKLRVELKAAQKVESTNSKKSKDSELLLLRQKCLRLEGALKEKDLALKRLNNEASLRLEGTVSRNSNTRLEVGDIEYTKQDKLNETVRVFGKTSSAGHSLPRSSHSTKTEVAKLREMIHKLEKENQELQQQVKDKGEEIRRLKMHLRSRTYVKSPQNSESKTVLKVTPTSKSEPVPNSSKSHKSTSIISKSSNPVSIQKPVKSQNLSTQTIKVSRNLVNRNNIQNVPKTLPKVQNSLQKHDVKNRKTNILCNGIPKSSEVKKQVNATKSVLPVTRPRKSLPLSKPVISNLNATKSLRNDTEDEIQKMRENIAAKRIQRSWRDHHKRNFKKDDHQNLQKALTFIVTSIKHHKLRKEKMSMLQKRKNLSPRMKIDDDVTIVEAVQTAARNMWEKEMSVKNTN